MSDCDIELTIELTKEALIMAPVHKPKNHVIMKPPPKPITPITMKVITDASVVKYGTLYKGHLGALVLREEEGKDLVVKYQTLKMHKHTSNMCEYLALEQGMTTLTESMYVNGETSIKKSNVNLELYTDSQLVFNQMMGNYKTRKQAFITVQNSIKRACKHFLSVKINWHSRNTDLAVLADFATKYPRKIRKLNDKFKGKPVEELTTEVNELLLQEQLKKIGNSESIN